MKAALHIQTQLAGSVTRLKSAYYTPPVKVADITEDRQSAVLQLMLMNASPGILDGDAYEMRIDVAAGTALQLHTQSYQRLFAMAGSASQHMQVHLGAGAAFHYLPHPVVPHKSTDFEAMNTVYLSGNCVLCWGEVLTCGRKLNGERFAYTRYRSVTNIYLNHKLVVKENLLLQPGSMPVQSMGMLEGYTHMASLVYLDEAMQVAGATEQLTSWLQLQPDILFGISAAPVSGVTVRLLGNKAEQLYDCLKRIGERLWLNTGNVFR